MGQMHSVDTTSSQAVMAWVGKPTRAVAAVLAIAILAGLVVMGFRQHRANQATAQRVDFNRDIRPILNKNCIACHGGVKQAGQVSFSYRAQVLGKGKSGRPTVIPGNPNASELIARVTSSDPELRMPLHEPPLQPAQVASLRQWIKEGAPWADYWAFVAPRQQALPSVRREDWVRQPLDRFILAQLEKESLAPAPEADKAALLRRVSLDLTGLPPTPQEQAAFLADSSPGAFERQVDRLLASPSYGERWASMWLDLARYGDSKGFEKDRDRPGVWPYRDWVIDAFNRNLPYDDFLTRQLAGDLLTDVTLDDRIATAFHRQTPANDEGGTDNEEFRLAAVMDRAATTWMVLNGVTFNCVQCHSHPYDPIRHVEYYRFLAFFNTSRDADMSFDVSLDDDWPVLRIPLDRSLYAESDRLQREITALRAEVVEWSRQSASREGQWTPLALESALLNDVVAFELELEHLQNQLIHSPSSANPAAREALTGQIDKTKKDLARARANPGPSPVFRIRDGTAEITGTVPVNSVLELTAAVDISRMTALRIEVSPADITKARHTPEKGFIVNRIRAWMIRRDGHSDEIPFRLLAPDSEADLEANMARQLRHSGAGKSLASADLMGRLADHSGLMANPNLFQTRWVVGVPSAPVEMSPGSRLKVQLTQTEAIMTAPAPVPRVRLSVSADPRWTALVNGPKLENDISRLESLERLVRKIPSVPLPVMAEQAVYEQRETMEFERGNFLTKTGVALSPDVPALFPALPADAPRNRLALAKWFFSPRQPLTARVAVNRYWEQLFGTGIVETLEDFGSSGETPSHPELIDWLALHFQNNLKWGTKALLRELVLSATYRQSAEITPVLREKDPRNRLLARGPQQRLTAEMVRDQALLASGLLTTKIGGPPVMPPQPSGVWNSVVSNTQQWIDAVGPNRYRRAVYTYIKRTSIYPSLLAFDASDRQLALARRTPTNTPLQALMTLNDPVYQEAARALAGRMIDVSAEQRTGDGVDNRLNYGARCVLSRDLRAAELKVLRQLHDNVVNGALSPKGQAQKVSSSIMQKSTPSNERELTALAAVATALLNLDAALTR